MNVISLFIFYLSYCSLLISASLPTDTIFMYHYRAPVVQEECQALEAIPSRHPLRIMHGTHAAEKRFFHFRIAENGHVSAPASPPPGEDHSILPGYKSEKNNSETILYDVTVSLMRLILTHIILTKCHERAVNGHECSQECVSDRWEAACDILGGRVVDVLPFQLIAPLYAYVSAKLSHPPSEGFNIHQFGKFVRKKRNALINGLKQNKLSAVDDMLENFAQLFKSIGVF